MARRVAHPSVDDRGAKGLEARDRAALSGHSGWKPATDRPDPVELLVAQETTREPDLIPVRHGRMMVSPFTFYRGAAKIMAADLAGTPAAGLEAQLCGDAQLSNFGGFASPEQVLLFDLNDFDETLPGPFEHDGRPGPSPGLRRDIMHPMFKELFLDTDADDQPAEQDQRRRVRRSQRARPAMIVKSAAGHRDNRPPP